MSRQAKAEQGRPAAVGPASPRPDNPLAAAGVPQCATAPAHGVGGGWRAGW